MSDIYIDPKTNDWDINTKRSITENMIYTRLATKLGSLLYNRNIGTSYISTIFNQNYITTEQLIHDVNNALSDMITQKYISGLEVGIVNANSTNNILIKYTDGVTKKQNALSL